MTFTIDLDYDRDDDQIVEELYWIGKNNPRHQDNACSPFPYMLRPNIKDMLQGDKPVALAYDDEDGELAACIQFDSKGRICNVVVKYFFGPNGEHTPKGLNMMETLFQAVRDNSESGKLISTDKNPNNREFLLSSGAEFEE